MNRNAILGGVVALVLLAGGATFYYLQRPVAEEASLANALEAVASDPATGEDALAAEQTAAPAAPADLSGTWSVNTDIGDFNFADATSTFVGFRVNEELNNLGQTEAVGRTPGVTGQLDIDGMTLTSAMIVADFAVIESDVPRRDNAMRRALGVDANPTATFALTEPVDFGEIPEEGQSITFTATGDLTVNGLTNPTSFDMEGQVADGNILVVGRAPVLFADYGITAPVLGPVVSIADNGTIELQLWFSLA